jgi:hypothetical protein
MSESTSNVEFAHRVHEQGHHHPPPSDRRAVWIGIAEAIVLSIVAVATAWSGYQAARWEAASAKQYAMASQTSMRSQEKATLAGQDRLYDIVTFNGWMAAKTMNNEKLVAIYQRRFRPEYAIAFAAWEKLDPFNNPSAPAGPVFMAEYKNANAQESERLAQQANEEFEAGVNTRETGDSYVKVTVFLATVLLLTALSQRFEIFGPRVAVVAVAFMLLIISTYLIMVLPRA